MEEKKFIYANDFKEIKPFDVIIEDWKKVYAAPYGISRYMFDECRIRSVSEKYNSIIKLNTPEFVGKINTTADNRYNATFTLWPGSLAYDTLQEAIDAIKTGFYYQSIGYIVQVRY